MGVISNPPSTKRPSHQLAVRGRLAVAEVWRRDPLINRATERIDAHFCHAILVGGGSLAVAQPELQAFLLDQLLAHHCEPPCLTKAELSVETRSIFPCPQEPCRMEILLEHP